MEEGLPEIGHLSGRKNIRVQEPIGRVAFVSKGKHIIVGQRRNVGATEALVFLGKCIEHTALRDTYDANVWLDIQLPHVVYICGKRGSGKSYDLGILLEGLGLGKSSKVTTKDNPITTVVFDTQSQFWTSLVEPSDTMEEDRKQLKTLKEWKLQPSSINNMKLFIPKGDPKLLGKEVEFMISPTEMDVDDWCGLLQVERYSPTGQCMRSVYKKVTTSGYRYLSSGVTQREIAVSPKLDYELSDLVECLKRDIELNDQTQRSTRDAVLWRLESLVDSKLFGKSGLDIKDVISPGYISVFMLRSLDDATKSLVVSVFAKKIFRIMGEYHTQRRVARRMGRDTAAPTGLPGGVWIIIDEAHVICPSGQVTAAKPSLIEYVKRGRDAGLSLVLATQQPAAIDSAVLSQVDLTLVHRLVLDSDIGAAISRFPSHFPSAVRMGDRDIADPRILIRLLDDGEVLLGDAETDRGFLVLMRPRLTAHGGDEPTLLES